MSVSELRELAHAQSEKLSLCDDQVDDLRDLFEELTELEYKRS